MPGTNATAIRTAAVEGDVTVLLIGMRINHFWAVHHWLPVFLAMPRMLRELAKDPKRGLLNHVLLTASPRTYYVVQYWESKEKLYEYAHSPDMFHHRAWAVINRKERKGQVRGHVGCGTRRTSCPRGRTSRSTPTCRPSGSRRRTDRCRWSDGEARAGPLRVPDAEDGGRGGGEDGEARRRPGERPGRGLRTAKGPPRR